MSNAVAPQALHKLLKGMNSAQMGFVAQAAAQLIATSTTVAEPTSFTVPAASTITMKKGAVSANVKATRPLNLYIAFRTYYSKMFPGLQQKEISVLLTLVWRNDNAKAKWSILAKAYSIIRDATGKENASLELFLGMNAPIIGMVEPGNYLAFMGYEMSRNEFGQMKLVQRSKPNAASLKGEYFATNVSVDDIICNCVACGYVNGNQVRLTMPADQATLTMATSASSVNTSQAIHGPSESNSTEATQSVQSLTQDDDEVFMSYLTDEIAGMDSEMKTIAEVVEATDGVELFDAVDNPMLAGQLETDTGRADEEFLSTPALNMPVPSPHGWDLSANTYDPFQGDAFNAYNISLGMDDPNLFDEFTDPAFTQMMDEYFF
ncbi:hypothetical protein MMC30_003029 [Trapelia coarctata]|nr:hypothetical protein [Trapelia coarctata]